MTVFNPRVQGPLLRSGCISPKAPGDLKASLLGTSVADLSLGSNPERVTWVTYFSFFNYEIEMIPTL